MSYPPCQCGLCVMYRKDIAKRGKETVENGYRLYEVLGWYRVPS